MTVEANNDEVICPNCVIQFRAIPVNVQKEIARLEAELAALKEDLHDERTRGLALLEDAKHWQSELVKCEADKFHFAAELAALKSQQPVAWGMPYKEGQIYDVICPEEHDQREGLYTIPLYRASGAMITHTVCMCGKDVK